MSREMREALLVLSQVDARQLDHMPEKIKIGDATDPTPIWDYVQQIVGDVMSQEPATWVPWLSNLSNNGDLSPIVGRVLSMHALQVYLRDGQISDYILKPNAQYTTIRAEAFRTTHTETYLKLRAVGDYIKANPQHGQLVKEVFSWGIYAFGAGRTISVFGDVIKDCGLV
jgi:hypothetical protein